MLEALKSGELTLDKFLQGRRYTLSPKQLAEKIAAIERERDAAAMAEPTATLVPAQSTDQEQKIRDVEMAAEHMTDPEDLDRFLKTLGSLDTRIEKAIARLACVKEYKKLYGRKQETD